jgi:hypothetical protein
LRRKSPAGMLTYRFKVNGGGQECPPHTGSTY